MALPTTFCGWSSPYHDELRHLSEEVRIYLACIVRLSLAGHFFAMQKKPRMHMPRLLAGGMAPRGYAVLADGLHFSAFHLLGLDFLSSLPLQLPHLCSVLYTVFSCMYIQAVLVCTFCCICACTCMGVERVNFVPFALSLSSISLSLHMLW